MLAKSSHRCVSVHVPLVLMCSTILCLFTLPACAEYTNADCGTTSVSSVGSFLQYSNCNSPDTVITISAAAGVSFYRCTFAGVTHPSAMSNYFMEINGGSFSRAGATLSFAGSATSVTMSIHSNAAISSTGWSNMFDFVGVVNGLRIDVSNSALSTIGANVMKFSSGITGSGNRIIISSSTISSAYQCFEVISSTIGLTFSMASSTFSCSYYNVYFADRVSNSGLVFVDTSVTSLSVDNVRVNSGTFDSSSLTISGGTWVAPITNSKSNFRQNSAAMSNAVVVIDSGASLTAVTPVYVHSSATASGSGLTISVMGATLWGASIGLSVGQGQTTSTTASVYISGASVTALQAVSFTGAFSGALSLALTSGSFISSKTTAFMLSGVTSAESVSLFVSSSTVTETDSASAGQCYYLPLIDGPPQTISIASATMQCKKFFLSPNPLSNLFLHIHLSDISATGRFFHTDSTMTRITTFISSSRIVMDSPFWSSESQNNNINITVESSTVSFTSPKLFFELSTSGSNIGLTITGTANAPSTVRGANSVFYGSPLSSSTLTSLSIAINHADITAALGVVGQRNTGLQTLLNPTVSIGSSATITGYGAYIYGSIVGGYFYNAGMLTSITIFFRYTGFVASTSFTLQSVTAVSSTGALMVMTNGCSSCSISILSSSISVAPSSNARFLQFTGGTFTGMTVSIVNSSLLYTPTVADRFHSILHASGLTMHGVTIRCVGNTIFSSTASTTTHTASHFYTDTALISGESHIIIAQPMSAVAVTAGYVFYSSTTTTISESAISIQCASFDMRSLPIVQLGVAQSSTLRLESVAIWSSNVSNTSAIRIASGSSSSVTISVGYSFLKVPILISQSRTGTVTSVVVGCSWASHSHPLTSASFPSSLQSAVTFGGSWCGNRTYQYCYSSLSTSSSVSRESGSDAASASTSFSDTASLTEKETLSRSPSDRPSPTRTSTFSATSPRTTSDSAQISNTMSQSPSTTASASESNTHTESNATTVSYRTPSISRTQSKSASVERSETPTFQPSDTDSIRSPSRSTIDTDSTSLAPSSSKKASATSTVRSSLSDTPSYATRTLTMTRTTSLSRTLSPVVPLAFTVSPLSYNSWAPTLFYRDDGVPVYQLPLEETNNDGTLFVTLQLFPRLWNNEEVGAGWFRHPQAVPRINATSSSDVVVAATTACELLPCNVTVVVVGVLHDAVTRISVVISYVGFATMTSSIALTVDRSAVGLLLQLGSWVTLGNSAGDRIWPTASPCPAAYLVLQLVDSRRQPAIVESYDFTLTTALSPSDGSPASALTTIIRSFSGSSEVVDVLADVAPLAPGQYTLSYAAVRTDGSTLPGATVPITVVTCPPAVSIVVSTTRSQSQQVVEFFGIPASVRDQQLRCRHSNATLRNPLRISACSVCCEAPVDIYASVSLIDDSAQQVLRLPVWIGGTATLVATVLGGTVPPRALSRLVGDAYIACASIGLVDPRSSSQVELSSYNATMQSLRVVSVSSTANASHDLSASAVWFSLSDRFTVCAFNITTRGEGLRNFPATLTAVLQGTMTAVLGNGSVLSVPFSANVSVDTVSDPTCLWTPRTVTAIRGDPTIESSSSDVIVDAFNLSANTGVVVASPLDALMTPVLMMNASHECPLTQVLPDLISSLKFTGTLASCYPPLPSTHGGVVLNKVELLRPDGYIDTAILQRYTAAVPLVHSVEGCSRGAYPSTAECPLNGTQPLTIVGSGFLHTDFILVWTFSSDAAPVRCLEKVVVSDSEVRCLKYPGAGVGGRTEVWSADGSTVLSRSNATLSFTLAGLIPCPMGPSGVTCDGHGSCDLFTGLCSCYQSSATGYWAGLDCSYCSLRYNSSLNCALKCPASDESVICSGIGYCSQGQCWCTSTWSAVTCQACPGSDGPCSGHGRCDTVSGTCTCSRSAVFGYFDGPACDVCVEGYSGSTCTVACPTGGAHSTVCSDRGACQSGVCFCVAPFCGVACELDGRTQDCLECSLPSLFGLSCTNICPGSSQDPTSPCSGHGTCDAGQYGTGLCKCADGYGTSDCSVACPMVNEVVCGGHGTCSSATGTCTCERDFATRACTVACPSRFGITCSGHGSCDDGSSGAGRCVCDFGFSGPACDVTCQGDLPCSGHGICGGDGVCQCFFDRVKGFWAGESCSSCADEYAGRVCNERCPQDAFNRQCGGHGVCGRDLTCVCFRDSLRGFWNGAVCTECELGYFGAACDTECPGGACSPCDGRGICSQGVAGTGTCTCIANDVFGWFGGADCSTCAAGYYGDRCLFLCPTLSGTVCPNGRCDDGRSGTGQCICNVGFALNSFGHCLQCQRNYYGQHCTPCPATVNGTCSSRGVCDDGVSGSGKCRCSGKFGGEACESNCPTTPDGTQCGHGTCTASGLCVCHANYALDAATGLCTDCARGYYGLLCNATCPSCLFGACDRVTGVCRCQHGFWGTACELQCPGGAANPCNGNGDCNPSTGVCTCFASPANGFFTGATCSSCDPRYESHLCRTPCPMFGGLACRGRGSCFNGRCSDCAPMPSEIGLIGIVCGSSCELTDNDCFNTTCPHGLYGLFCDQLCPGATPSDRSTTCSGHGYCDSSDGACHCTVGYFGNDCSSSCSAALVNGVVRVCSARGSCRAGLCQCLPGYFGRACEIECPGGATNPCNGRGSCVNGTCHCTYGASGRACEIICPGGMSAPCSYHGVCQATGFCQCNADLTSGFFVGDACDTCAELFTGRLCNVRCLPERGLIVDRECRCFAGFAGSDCSLSCSRGQVDGLVCGGHGTCIGQELCQCDADYFGPRCSQFCTYEHCRTTFGLYRPQCNGMTGICECRSSSIGQWVGARCSECSPAMWGDECNVPCSCNGNGLCDRVTGRCSCFSDPISGFWSGTACAVCRSGYFGERCQSVNVQITPAVPPTATPRAVVSGPVNGWMMVDATVQLVLQGNAQQMFIRLLDIDSVTGSVAEVRQLPSLAGTTGATVLNASHIFLSIVGGGRVFLLRDRAYLLHSPSMPLPQGGRKHIFKELGAAVSTLSPVYVIVAQTRLCVLLWRLAVPELVECDGTFAFDFTGPASMSRVSFVGASNDSVVVIGDSADDGSSSFVFVRYNLTSHSMIVTKPSSSSSGEVLRCVITATLDDVICITYNRLLRLLQLQKTDLRSGNIIATYPVESSTLDANATALGVDAGDFDTAFVAYNFAFQPSTVLTFRISSLMPIGTFALPGSYVVTGLQVDSPRRLLIGVVEDAVSVAFLSLNLFGISSVVPDVVDTAGGAMLIIRGEGFDPNVANDTWCIVSSVSIRATFIDTNAISCVAPPATHSLGACVRDTLDVRFGSRRTSQTTVTILRPVAAAVLAAVTDLGTVGYGSAEVPANVTLLGFGFVPSRYATCRLINSSGGVVFESRAYFINFSAAVCTQPAPLPPTDTWSGLQYSHDGTYYGTSSAHYILVGPAATILFEQTSRVLESARVTSIGVLTIYTADQFYNKRLVLEDRDDTIRCSSNIPDVAIINSPELFNFSARTELRVRLERGAAVFDRVLLDRPPAGPMRLHCFSFGDTKVATAVEFRIIPGAAASIVVLASDNWKATVRSDSLLLPQPRVLVEDVSRNRIFDFSKLPYSVTLSFPKATVDERLGIATWNVSMFVAVPDEGGLYSFAGVVVRTAFDVPIAMTFAASGIPSVVRPLAEERCEPGKSYAVTNSFTCAECPEEALCDGTSRLQTRPGFWRGSQKAVAFYPCTPPSACPSSSACAKGYTGRRCQACEAGYGYSLGECTECFTDTVNYFLNGLGFLVALLVVLQASLLSMPVTSFEEFDARRRLGIAENKDEKPNALVIKLLQSHVQMLTSIPFGSLALPMWLKTLFATGKSGASANPKNLIFVSCTVASTVADQLYLAIGFIPALTLALALTAAFLAWSRSDRSLREKEELERRKSIESGKHNMNERIESAWEALEQRRRKRQQQRETLKQTAAVPAKWQNEALHTVSAERISRRESFSLFSSAEKDMFSPKLGRARKYIVESTSHVDAPPHTPPCQQKPGDKDVCSEAATGTLRDSTVHAVTDSCLPHSYPELPEMGRGAHHEKTLLKALRTSFVKSTEERNSSQTISVIAQDLDAVERAKRADQLALNDGGSDDGEEHYDSVELDDMDCNNDEARRLAYQHGTLLTDTARQLRAVLTLAEELNLTAEDRQRLLEHRASLFVSDDVDDKNAFFEELKTAANEDDRLRRRDFLLRFTNMVSVAFVCVLFELYPTLVEYSVSLLNCVEMNTQDEGIILVMSSDAQVRCDSQEYTHIWYISGFVLFCCAFVIPLFLAVFIKFIASTTCRATGPVAYKILTFSRTRKRLLADTAQSVASLSSVHLAGVNEFIERTVGDDRGFVLRHVSQVFGSRPPRVEADDLCQRNRIDDFVLLEAKFRSEFESLARRRLQAIHKAIQDDSDRLSLRAARSIFFFVSGSYRLWYWESISMIKKLLLVIVNQQVVELPLRILMSVWIVLAYVVINAQAKPWSSSVMALAENISLCALALTFGFCGLLFFSEINGSEVMLTVVVVGVLVVNFVTVLALLRTVVNTADSATGIYRKVFDVVKRIYYFFARHVVRSKLQAAAKVYNNRKRISRSRRVWAMMGEAALLVDEARSLMNSTTGERKRGETSYRVSAASESTAAYAGIASDPEVTSTLTTMLQLQREAVTNQVQSIIETAIGAMDASSRPNSRDLTVETSAVVDARVSGGHLSAAPLSTTNAAVGCKNERRVMHEEELDRVSDLPTYTLDDDSDSDAGLLMKFGEFDQPTNEEQANMRKTALTHMVRLQRESAKKQIRSLLDEATETPEQPHALDSNECVVAPEALLPETQAHHTTQLESPETRTLNGRNPSTQLVQDTAQCEGFKEAPEVPKHVAWLSPAELTSELISELYRSLIVLNMTQRQLGDPSTHTLVRRISHVVSACRSVLFGAEDVAMSAVSSPLEKSNAAESFPRTPASALMSSANSEPVERRNESDDVSNGTPLDKDPPHIVTSIAVCSGVQSDSGIGPTGNDRDAFSAAWMYHLYLAEKQFFQAFYKLQRNVRHLSDQSSPLVDTNDETRLFSRPHDSTCISNQRAVNIPLVQHLSDDPQAVHASSERNTPERGRPPLSVLLRGEESMRSVVLPKHLSTQKRLDKFVVQSLQTRRRNVPSALDYDEDQAETASPAPTGQRLGSRTMPLTPRYTKTRRLWSDLINMRPDGSEVHPTCQ